jgi:hypothetical protein
MLPTESIIAENETDPLSFKNGKVGDNTVSETSEAVILDDRSSDANWNCGPGDCFST